MLGGTRKWLLNVLIGFDQLVNALIWGYPDETISSRAGRGYGKHWYWTWLGKVLNWLDPNHVVDAVKHEKDDSHAPPELRRG